MSEVQPERVGQSGKLLVVDDEAPLRRLVSRALEKAGHEVVQAEDGQSALKEVERHTFDAVLSDIAMPGLDGVSLLRAIRERDLDVPVVLLTGNPSVESAMKAVEYGAFEYLTKPVELDRIRSVMSRALALGRIARAKRSAIDSLDDARHRAGDRAGLEATFDRAMTTLWAAFQPIVTAKTGDRYGHEALMRSREPALPHPGAVLEAAEKLNRLPELGSRMRELSALPVAADAGSGYLFVNLHPRDLFDDSILAKDAPLTSIAERVVLEITERASIEALGDARERAAQLRDLGFRIAIDDLGAGYAGLTAFAVLEPEIVKLDMSLIRGVEKSPVKQKLIHSMTSLCHELGMLVVAEGIETNAELQCVTDLGCDLLQGYLLAKPGPPFPSIGWPP